MRDNFRFSIVQTIILVLVILSIPFLTTNSKSLQTLRAGGSLEVLVEDFTVVVLPDTQHYSQSFPNIFDNQTQWIVDNIEKLNIIFVTHEGDVVELDNVDQWENANQSLSLLDGQVPWGILPGNHDDDLSDTGFTSFELFFGVDRFSGESWYGEGYNSGNANNYELFSGGQDDYLIFHLQYNPSIDVLLWANGVISAYHERKVIITTHAYLGYDAKRVGIGERIWVNLVLPNADQVFLVLCGHNHIALRRADMVNSSVVYQLLADYQEEENGGNGWLRILRFSPMEDKIYVSTYSPYLDSYKTDGNNQFVLDFDMTVDIDPSPTPEPTPTASPTPTPEPTPILSPSPTPSPTIEPTSTPSPTVSPTSSPIPTASSSITPTPSIEPTPTGPPIRFYNPYLILFGSTLLLIGLGILAYFKKYRKSS